MANSVLAVCLLKHEANAKQMLFTSVCSKFHSEQIHVSPLKIVFFLFGHRKAS